MAKREAAPAPAAGITEHHLSVPRTARYYLHGDPGLARHVWLGCHGYGQLAGAFIGYLSTAASTSRLLVAPEALSRFYHDNGLGPVDDGTVHSRTARKLAGDDSEFPQHGWQHTG